MLYFQGKHSIFLLCLSRQFFWDIWTFLKKKTNNFFIYIWECKTKNLYINETQRQTEFTLKQYFRWSEERRLNSIAKRIHNRSSVKRELVISVKTTFVFISRKTHDIKHGNFNKCLTFHLYIFFHSRMSCFSGQNAIWIFFPENSTC